MATVLPQAVALLTKKLRIGYVGSKPLFEDLDLTIEAGRLVCFMGPNGVGKSTLIRTLAGIQKPISGEICLISSGEQTRPAEQISVVLTDKLSAGNMTVYELITFGRYPYLQWNIRLSKSDKKIINEALALVHIEDLADKKIFELSDGQLQLALIGRALAQDTPIILLDEPTAHLDLNNRVEIMKLLRDLTRRLNKAIVMATHDLDLALQTADCIWLAGRNKNIMTGLPEDLVLSGTFDEVFQFKGFDLKTGKVQHHPIRNISIALHGHGYEYLWTKNALERNGYAVADENCHYRIVIDKKDDILQWVVNDTLSFTSLRDLLLMLP